MVNPKPMDNPKHEEPSTPIPGTKAGRKRLTWGSSLHSCPSSRDSTSLEGRNSDTPSSVKIWAGWGWLGVGKGRRL
jgi:hypothetical protein